MSLSQKTSAKGIRAVAERAGVSTASVSRALNRPNSVSAELRARVAAAVRVTGYIPHAPARALSTRRTRTLGAIIPTIDNTMFARGIAALQKYLSSAGYMLLLTTNDYDLDAEYERLRTLGIAFEAPPKDQSWLWREAYLRDPDSNLICLYHAGVNRRFPPWRIADRDETPAEQR